jgi:glycosyltransferase involved in cell wall biosynthesis
MRILLLTQWFTPEPIQKGMPFAKTLSDKGHQVQVLTGFPNYPTGKLYPGFKLKIFQKEFIDDIEIIRVPLYPSHDQSVMHRLFNYISFAMSATFLGLFLIKKADAMYVYHPPGSIAIPAIILKYFRRIPIVYDIQDMWPETLKATGFVKNDFILKLVEIICNLFYKFFDSITVISEGFKNILIERGVPASKIHVIYNWSNSKSICEGAGKYFREQFDLKNKFILLYAGNIGKAQGLESVLVAANKLKSNSNIQFLFIGNGIELNNLKKIKDDLSLTNVLFLPAVPPDKISGFLINADVLLVHLKDDPLFKITIPSKIQAYLMIGKPILVAVKGDAADLVKKAKAGLICQPENSDDIVDKVLEFYKMSPQDRRVFGLNGKNFYSKYLSLDRGADKFIDIFKSVAN